MEKSTQAQEVAGRISGAVAGKVLHQAYQVPIINSYLLHYIIAICLSFSSPPLLKHFQKKTQKYLPFIRLLFICLYVLLGLFARFLGIIVCLLRIRKRKVYGST